MVGVPTQDVLSPWIGMWAYFSVTGWLPFREVTRAARWGIIQWSGLCPAVMFALSRGVGAGVPDVRCFGAHRSWLATPFGGTAGRMGGPFIWCALA